MVQISVAKVLLEASIVTKSIEQFTVKVKLTVRAYVFQPDGIFDPASSAFCIAVNTVNMPGLHFVLIYLKFSCLQILPRFVAFDVV